MGGQTGTEISPIIAEIAKKRGVLTIGIVTRPFYFEGRKRKIQADKGIKELKDKTDVLVTISNDNLLKIINKDISIGDTFELINKILYQSVKTITDLITTQTLINLEISDVRKVLENAGLASLSRHRDRKGERESTYSSKNGYIRSLIGSINKSSKVLISKCYWRYRHELI